MTPDKDRAQDRISERRHERAEHVENIVDAVETDFSNHEYPVSSEELSREYADQAIDIPNETESLGSVFDRLTDERYDSPEGVREALYNELTGETSGKAEFNEERSLRDLEERESSEL